MAMQRFKVSCRMISSTSNELTYFLQWHGLEFVIHSPGRKDYSRCKNRTLHKILGELWDFTYLAYDVTEKAWCYECSGRVLPNYQITETILIYG